MIKSTTKEVNEKTIDSELVIRGSAKEIIADFYALHDYLMTDSSLALLYGIAIKKMGAES